MNIVEYRALKAQEEQTQSSQNTDSQGGTPDVQTQQTATTSATQTNETPSQDGGATNQGGEQATASNETNPTEITHVEIPGVGEVPLEELANGYLRQQDYTRKTQELAKVRQQSTVAQQLMSAIQSNPQLAETLAQQGITLPDPREMQLKEMTDKYHDLLLEQEVKDLQGRYNDFDAQTVLKFAFDNKYENLEDAYLLLKSRQQATTQPVDVASLTEQIRQQVLQELQSNVDTTTIIQTGGDSTQVRDNTPTLTNQELKIARNLRMTPEEYAKWRDRR